MGIGPARGPGGHSGAGPGPVSAAANLSLQLLMHWHDATVTPSQAQADAAGIQTQPHSPGLRLGQAGESFRIQVVGRSGWQT